MGKVTGDGRNIGSSPIQAVSGRDAH